MTRRDEGYNNDTECHVNGKNDTTYHSAALTKRCRTEAYLWAVAKSGGDVNSAVCALSPLAREVLRSGKR